MPDFFLDFGQKSKCLKSKGKVEINQNMHFDQLSGASSHRKAGQNTQHGELTRQRKRTCSECEKKQIAQMVDQVLCKFFTKGPEFKSLLGKIFLL